MVEENKDPEGKSEEEGNEVFSQDVKETFFPPSRRESNSSMIFSPLREPDGSPLSQVSLGQLKERSAPPPSSSPR